MTSYSQARRNLINAVNAVTEALKRPSEYRMNLRNGVRALWTGEWDYVKFYEQIDAAIERAYTQAWYDALASINLTPDDMTRDERTALRSAIVRETQFIDGLAIAVEKNSKANGGKLYSLYGRLELWVNRYNGIKAQALTLAKSDPPLEWIQHAEESCNDCDKLSGQVRRASTWDSLGLRPQAPQLECMESAGGIPVCRCELVPTDKPLSRGRVPSV